jgi:hypothetical protein
MTSVLNLAAIPSVFKPDVSSQTFSTTVVQTLHCTVFIGTVSRDGYFFEGINILISTFCVCAEGFQGLSETFHYPIQLLTFYWLL